MREAVWRKLKSDDFWKDRLSVAIGLGLCCLPVVFVAAALLFDVRTAWLALVVAFIVILIVCNAMCRFRSKDKAKRSGRSESYE